MRSSPDNYVFDSFALLAFLQREPGFAPVQTLLRLAMQAQCRIYLCVVNYGEVLYITERRKGRDAALRVVHALEQLPLTLVDANKSLTVAAARIKARYPLAYADAFAAALAQESGATLVTGDSEFRAVEALVSIQWLNQPS